MTKKKVLNRKKVLSVSVSKLIYDMLKMKSEIENITLTAIVEPVLEEYVSTFKSQSVIINNGQVDSRHTNAKSTPEAEDQQIKKRDDNDGNDTGQDLQETY